MIDALRTLTKGLVAKIDSIDWHSLENKPFTENGVIDQKALPKGFPYSGQGTIQLLSNFPLYYIQSMGSEALGRSLYSSPGFDIVSKQYYTIIWDSQKYECQSTALAAMNNIPCLGNKSIINILAGTNYEDTGEPFIALFDQGDAMYFTMDTEEASHNVSISTIGEVITPIDNKYLPNFYTKEETYSAEQIEEALAGKQNIGDYALSSTVYKKSQVDNLLAGKQAAGDYALQTDVEEVKNIAETQSDWTVADDSNAAYIKNRTHYYTETTLQTKSFYPSNTGATNITDTLGMNIGYVYVENYTLTEDQLNKLKNNDVYYKLTISGSTVLYHNNSIYISESTYDYCVFGNRRLLYGITDGTINLANFPKSLGSNITTSENYAILFRINKNTKNAEALFFINRDEVHLAGTNQHISYLIQRDYHTLNEKYLPSNLIYDSRSINGKSLNTDITLTASDVGAAPASAGLPTVSASNNGKILQVNNGAWAIADAPQGFSGSWNDLTNKPFTDMDALIAEIKTQIGYPVISATAPTLTNSNILWIDTSNGGIAKYHNGSAWVAITSVWK